MKHNKNGNCECKKCINKKKSEEDNAKKKLIIQEQFDVKQFNPISIESIEDSNLLMIYCIYITLENNNLECDLRGKGFSFNAKDIYKLAKLIPGHSIEDIGYILKSLYECGALIVDPETDMSLFNFNSSITQVISFGPCDVNFMFNVENIMDFINNFFEKNYVKSLDDLDLECLIEECIEYLIYQLSDYNLHMNEGHHYVAKLIFGEIILSKYTLGQIYCMIWSSVRKSVLQKVKYGGGDDRVIKISINNIFKYYEQATANKWDVKEYSRPSVCAGSMIRFVIDKLKISKNDSSPSMDNNQLPC